MPIDVFYVGSMKLNRRHFLAKSGVVAAGGLAVPGGALGASHESTRSGGKPRHIIHLVSDGMSAGMLTCADQFSLLVRRRPSAWMKLYSQPGVVNALVNTRSLNSLVTDSAAAASSWGCGSRVLNGALNMFPDGRELKTLYALLGEEGWARGLVTTTEITHATPAGFAVNVPDRGQADRIAEQYLERRIEVLLGGGRQFFLESTRGDKRDLKGDYAQAGYFVMENRAQLAEAPVKGRWLGIFTRGHLPYTIDQRADSHLQATVPTLGEMTRAALRRLESERHFILQVEGGRVDHAAHDSDAAGAIWDQLAFDEALEVCLDFQRRQPDTLLVVTTDHGNANPGLNGMGGNYGRSTPLFANLTRVRKSLSGIEQDIRRARGDGGISAEELADIIGDATGYDVPERQAKLFQRFLDGGHAPLYDLMNSFSAQLGQLLANHVGIGWAGTSHTGDYVVSTAVGPGAEGFSGLLQNTDFFHRYAALAGIRFRNPELPLMAECGPSASAAEGLIECTDRRNARREVWA
jgi:alkaline phosphatase